MVSRVSIVTIVLKTLREYAPPLVVSLGSFLLWELGVMASRVPSYILPSPSMVLVSLAKWRDPILMHARFTLESTLIGFGVAIIIGLILGMAIGYSALVYRSMYPLLVAFNSVPKVAIVPVLVIWFGVGQIPAILTAFLISFFPIVVNVATGLATVEPEVRDIFRSLGASKSQMFTKVGMPRSMPYFFASLKVSSTLAFVGAVISETVAGNTGVGYLMIAASSRFDVALVFAGLLVIAALGVGIFILFAILDRWLTSWAYR